MREVCQLTKSGRNMGVRKIMHDVYSSVSLKGNPGIYIFEDGEAINSKKQNLQVFLQVSGSLKICILNYCQLPLSNCLHRNGWRFSGLFRFPVFLSTN